MPLTAPELTKLRDTHPHSITPYLSVHTPQAVFAGIVDGDQAKGAVSIPVITFTGDLADVEPGMTMYVDQVGGTTMPRIKRRVRRVDLIDDEVLVDENGMEWSDSDIITIVKNYELWAVFPRMVPDPDEDDAVLFYKDYDLPYTVQNEESSPVAQIKGERCKIADSLPVTFPLIGADSYGTAQGTSIVSWTWECDEAVSFTPNNTAANPTLAFDAYYPDGIWVKLTVVDNNNVSHYTRRLIFIHSRTGTDAPNTEFTLTSLAGDWDQGGWRASIKGHSDFADYVDEGSHVILWHEATFGKVLTSSDVRDYIGPQTEILLEGVITKEEPAAGADGSVSTTLHINDIIQQLKERKTFSVSLTAVADPTKWYEYYQLTVSRALHHLYMWHSTLFEIANVKLPVEDNVLVSAVDDFTSNTLYNTGDTFARSYSIFAHMVANKMGDIYIEVEFNMLSDTERAAIPLEMTLTDADYAGDPIVRFVRNTYPRAWIVSASGTYYDGTTSTPLIGSAPGEVPDALGHKELKLERLVFADLNGAKIKAGRAYSIINMRMERLVFGMSGNYTFMDLVPQRRYQITLSSEQTGREEYEGIIVPRNISIGIDQVSGTVTQQVEFEPEAAPFEGVDIPVPEEPTFPDPPDPPDPPVWPEPVMPGYGDGFGTLYVLDVNYLCRTRDFSAASPVYTDVTAAAAGDDLADFILDPWNPYTVGYMVTSAGLYKSTDLDGVSPTFTNILPVATIASAVGATSVVPRKVIASINLQGYAAVVYQVVKTGPLYNAGCAYTFDGGATWAYSLIGTDVAAGLGFDGGFDYVPHLVGGHVVLYAGRGRSGARELYKSVNSGASWTLMLGPGTLGLGSDDPPGATVVHCPFHGNEAGNIVYAGWQVRNGNGILRSVDGGATHTVLALPSSYDGLSYRRTSIETHPSNNQLVYTVSGNSGSSNKFLYSLDGGDSWTEIYTFASGVCASGGFPTVESQFYALSTSAVLVSIDGGASWVDKTGNINSIVGVSITPGVFRAAVILPLWLEE